ncbi:MAG: NAD-dependent epimerase/dehydratase family protein [Deltaproteobacteria bacterium]|nr:NAD-dependent epimerase/dehydratase family protein [Deltaproteobacteria bacterium]
MKILITGAAGFIASHIQDAYLNEGHQVAVVDNLVTGKKENLNPKSHFFEMDILDPKLHDVFETFRPDIVSHHAAQMDVRRSVSDPTYDAQVNVLGFINLLEASRKVGVQKVIFASSGGAVYGEQDHFPADETHPTRPASPYGLTKMVGEEYLKLYERLYGLQYTALRYANIYGPRQNPHGEAGVVAIFCKKLLSEETPTINGDGKQTRDYVFVKDVVNANLMALKEEASGIYNIGTSVESDVNQLFSHLAKHSGKNLVQHGPAKLGEQLRSVISYQKVEKAWGWKPEYDFERGLQETFEWFKTHNK